MIELKFSGESLENIGHQMDSVLKTIFPDVVPVMVDQIAPPVDPVVPSTTLTPVTPTPPVQVETSVTPLLDKDGYPWEARIHAKTKTQTVKGIWKRKKGIDDVLYDAVRAETVPVAPVETPVETAPTLPVTPTTEPIAFLTVVQKVVELTTAGKVTKESIDLLLASYGVVGGMTALASNPDKIPVIWNELCAM